MSHPPAPTRVIQPSPTSDPNENRKGTNMAWQQYGLKWSPQLQQQHGGDMSPMFERLDVKELLVHLAPLIQDPRGMTTDQWSVELAIGAGMASLEARLIEDTRAEIVGVLRDFPSLYCTLDMKVKTDTTDQIKAEQIRLSLESISIELNGKD